MNSAEYVSNLITDLKNKGCVLSDVAWQAALACLGWAYVFGASGQDCTPSYRRQAYARHGQDHPTIRTSCKNFDGVNSCSGCKWYPGGKRTKVFDCRGFTYWILLQVYGWELQGGGCTSQWNTASNWISKGDVSEGIPQGVPVCVFYYKKDSQGKRTNTLEHTGLYYNGETVECSSGVQHSTTLDKKWEVWAVPACVNYKPEPVPEGYAIVTGKRVALRNAPSKQATVLMRINTGEKVKLETPPPSEWDYVSYENRYGYMMKEFLNEG